MKKRYPTTRNYILWGIAIGAMNVALFAGLLGLRAALDPPPEGGKWLVAELKTYKAAHGRYPATLREAHLPEELPGMARVIYSVVEGSNETAFELQIWRDVNGDESWTYKSPDDRWLHSRLSDGGGLSDFGGG